MGIKAVQRPPKAQNRYVARRRILAQELKPVAKTMEKSRAKIVAGWKNEPKFKADIVIKPEYIEITVVVRRGARLQGSKSGATTGDLWKWIDQTGTKPHPIPRQPKQKGVLAFTWGGPGSYKSKTGANPARYGGPGTVTGGKPTFAKQVQHPGFEPRHFSDVIDKDVEKDFKVAYERASRKANKAGY